MCRLQLNNEDITRIIVNHWQTQLITGKSLSLCKLIIKFGSVRLDPSAADSRRHRQLESSGAAASRKTDGAPPSQLKLWDAAAAEIFTARRGLQWL